MLGMGARAGRAHGWGLSRAISGTHDTHANRVRTKQQTLYVHDLGVLMPQGVGAAAREVHCERVAHETRGYGLALALPEHAHDDGRNAEILPKLIAPGAPVVGLAHVTLLALKESEDSVEWLVPALELGACETLAHAAGTLSQALSEAVAAIGRDRNPRIVRSTLARAQRRIDAGLDPQNATHIERANDAIDDAFDTLLGALAEECSDDAGHERIEAIETAVRTPRAPGASALARHYRRLASLLETDGWLITAWSGSETPKLQGAPRVAGPGTKIQRWRIRQQTPVTLIARALGMPVITWRSEEHVQWRRIALERTRKGQFEGRTPALKGQWIEVSAPEGTNVEAKQG